MRLIGSDRWSSGLVDPVTESIFRHIAPQEHRMHNEEKGLLSIWFGQFGQALSSEAVHKLFSSQDAPGLILIDFFQVID